MPIDIIPKKTETGFPFASILIYFSLVLFVGAILSLFVLGFYGNRSEKTLQQIENLINEKETPENKALEQEILGYKAKIDQTAPLLASHRKSSAFFSLLEKSSHPKVIFSTLSLNLKESKAALAGTTESFQTLGQQIHILKKEKLITNVILSEISIGEQGDIKFSLDLSLDPQIFKY